MSDKEKKRAYVKKIMMFDVLVKELMKKGLHDTFVTVMDATCKSCGKIRFAMIAGSHGDGINKANELLQKSLDDNEHTMTVDEAVDMLNIETVHPPAESPFQEMAKSLGAEIIHHEDGMVVMGIPRRDKEKKKDERKPKQEYEPGRHKVNID